MTAPVESTEAAVRRSTVEIRDKDDHRGQGLLLVLDDGDSVVLTCFHVINPIDPADVRVVLHDAEGNEGSVLKATYDSDRSRTSSDAAVLRVSGVEARVNPLLHELRPDFYAGSLKARGYMYLPPGVFEGSVAAFVRFPLEAKKSKWPNAPTEYKIRGFQLLGVSSSMPGISGGVVGCEGGVLGLVSAAQPESGNLAREAYFLPLSTWAEDWPALREHIEPLVDQRLRRRADVARASALADGVDAKARESSNAEVDAEVALRVRAALAKGNGVILVGPDGCGKSRLAAQIARERAEALVLMPREDPPEEFEPSTFAETEVLVYVPNLHLVSQTVKPQKWCNRLRGLQVTRSLVIATSDDGEAWHTVEQEQRDLLNGLEQITVRPPRSGRGGGRRDSASGVRNLIPPRSTFVGREADLEAITTLVREQRLVTLTGPGGCGKSRLGMKAAERLATEWPDKATFVSLAATEDADLVPKIVLEAFGQQLSAGHTWRETLVAHLRGKELLLVLDNCEHLRETCAELVDSVLDGAPHVRILATSREPLGVQGERVWEVPPLGVPDASDLGSTEREIANDSVRLFEERAREVDPSFELTPENARAAAEICQGLDGIPLAIELAAAQLRALSPRQIAGQLGDMFGLLDTGPIGHTRQQTLSAAVDWSYESLDNEERELFNRLSVTMGGCTLEAAKAIGSGSLLAADQVVTPLAHLVEKSLVKRWLDPEGESRYRQLEVMRQYGLARLESSGDTQEARSRHAEYFAELAAGTSVADSERGPLLQRLEIEHPNLRAALDWMVEMGRAPLAVHLVSGAWRLWYERGHYLEGLERTQAVLDLAEAEPPSEELAEVLNGAGNLAYDRGEYARAETFHRRSLEMRRALGADLEVAGSLNNLGLIARRRGRYEEARQLFEEARAINQTWRRTSWKATFWEAMNLDNLGCVEREETGPTDEAQSLILRSLALFGRLGDEWGTAMAIVDLGEVVFDRGDAAQAKEYLARGRAMCVKGGFQKGLGTTLNAQGRMTLARQGGRRAAGKHRKALEIFTQIGDRLGVAQSLEGLAHSCLQQEQYENSARLFGEAASIRGALDCPIPKSFRDNHERAVAVARERAGDGDFGSAWAAGQGLTLKDAIYDAAEIGGVLAAS
jgi:predicted ATPase